ncbi:MAG: hypothetical protein HRU19_23385 [Pseudobacteriovorax sp.]|nr:hypothetical protein [Pseudobacteriovorax sp.]
MKKLATLMIVSGCFIATTGFAEKKSTDSSQSKAKKAKLEKLTIEPVTVAFDPDSWAQCVLDAGLGSWAGSAFCTLGGVIADVVQ